MMSAKVPVACKKALLVVMTFALALAGLTPGHAQSSNRFDLRENWYVQSSCKLNTPAEVLSTSQFSPDHWYKTTVPSTVLAAQVANGEFKDIYYADNVRKLPGMDYPFGELFSNMDMASGSPYACSWWYRTEFQVPQDFRGRKLWLHFNGINYKANVWLNGRKLADVKDVAGAYRIYEFEATPLADKESTNVLAVEVFAPQSKDLGINFVDWNPTPPDKDMGLWRDVYLMASGPVRVRHPQVVTHLPGDSLQRADLTIRAELHNDTDASVEGVLQGKFETVSFEKRVELAPRESRSVTFTPDEFPQLKIEHPELWWPTGLGEQKLHLLSMKFESSGLVSDSQSASFGIREVTGELYGPPQPGEVYDNNGDFKRLKTDKRPLLIRVNHQPVLIRGAGWTPEMLLRSSEERLRAELGYVKDMHLNSVRLEGKLESEEFFNLADQMGIMVLAGWCCCDHWEHWKDWQPGDLTIATESLRGQILRLRSHPSVVLWMNGSDNPPPANVEEAYRKILAETSWPNAFISSASAMPTSVSGPSGVKMTGPYDYVPPGYWLIDDDHFGGAFGFNTETSPGAAIPEVSSLRKFLPQQSLWPINNLWNLHSGAGIFNYNLDHFNASMDAIYGHPKGLDEYILKSQAMAYDGERAMFEAFARNKYKSTGVIQWMLNNAWPSVIWHLYDYYLQPAAGYFGTKKACEPLHIQYSYDDRSIVVVNSVNKDFTGLTAEASVYNFNLRRLFYRKMNLVSAADSVQRLFTIPEENIDTDVHFVRLTLLDKTQRVVSTNFYWLPRKLSTYNWSTEEEKKHPYYTGITSYEDLSSLNHLEKVNLEATAFASHPGDSRDVRVQVHNPSRTLAFQVHLSVVDKNSGEEILPVLWEDNYFSLMPGESRVVIAHYNASPISAGLKLQVNGWNIAGQEISVEETGTH